MDANTQPLEAWSGKNHGCPAVSVPDCVPVKVYWDRFYSKRGSWFESRRAEGEPVFALPRGVIDHRIQSLFLISDAESLAEQIFAELCATFLAIGVCNGQLVELSLRRPGTFTSGRTIQLES